MDVLMGAWKMLWKIAGWVGKRLVFPVLAVAASLIPAVIIGDSRGRVAENEPGVVVASQWASAFAHISVFPALYFVIASAVQPQALWLLVLWIPAAAFWFSRRFSAHQAVELRVSDFLTGVSALISPADEEDVLGIDREPDTRRPKFAPWRILAGIALAIMAAAIPVALA